MACTTIGQQLPAIVHGARPCRLCGATLSAIERVRGDTCGRLACRHQGSRQRALLARDAALARRRASAARLPARLPARQIEGSCLHHGARGCTLTRELRSDICNQYACSALQSLQGDSAAGRAAAVPAAMEGGHTLGAAALLRPAGLRRLPRLPARKSDQT